MTGPGTFFTGFSFISGILQPIILRIEKNSVLKSALIILFYVLLTVILTYPVAFTIGTQVPGGGDTFHWMNSLWYTNFALSHPDITSLTHNNMIFYPTGIPVMPFPSAINQIIAVIFLPLCQIQVIYSVLWLLSFILAAFGAFILVRYLTQNDYAAFFSGIIFAFTPYHFVHGLGHMGATTIQWIPFCALFFIKVFREGGTKNCILAGFFYILVAMSDMQYLVFVGIFIGILFLFENYISFQSNKGFAFEAHKSIFFKYLVIGIVAFSIIIPLTLSDIQIATSENNFFMPDPLEAIKYSTDLLSFFLPSPLHPVFGEIVSPVYGGFSGTTAEHTTYIGYTVLILSIFALYDLWKDITVRFWGIIAILFSLFSMGPVLHLAGKTVFTVFNISIPLPHLILYYLIPFVDNCRTTGRFFIVAALAFAVLAGYGCCILIKRYDSKKVCIAVILCLVVLFEYLCIPIPMSPVDRPAFYQKMGQDPEQYALMEIPVTEDYDAGVRVIYYQTIHQKPIVGGQAARIPADARDIENNTPFIREITYLNRHTSQDILNQEYSVMATSVLNYYNIRYIVIHKNFLSDAEIENVYSNLPPSINQSNPLFNDKTTIVYEVPRDDGTPFFALSQGWYNNENWSGIPVRWMGDNATLLVYGFNHQLVQLQFQAYNFQVPRTLQIYSNNQLVTNVTIIERFTPVNVTIPVRKGENRIRFNVSEGCERPIDLPGSNSKDPRCLSVAVRNITIY